MFLLAVILFALPVAVPVMMGWSKVVIGYFLFWFSLTSFAVALILGGLLTAIVYPPQVIKSWVMFDSFVGGAVNSIEIGRGDTRVYNVLPPAEKHDAIVEFPGIQQPFKNSSGIQQSHVKENSGSGFGTVMFIPYLLILDIIYACIYFPMQHRNIIVWVLMLTTFVLNAMMWINFFRADLSTSTTTASGWYVNGFWRSSSETEPMLGDGGYYGNGYPINGYGNTTTGQRYKVNPDEHHKADGSLWRKKEFLFFPNDESK